MSAESLKKLRSEMLRLPERERAELAHELVISLDAPGDAHVEDAWDKEITRRLAEIEGGSAVLLDRDTFRRRLRERLATT